VPQRPRNDEVTPELRDRKLGMHRRITRRDFLNGVSIAVGGSALASSIGQLSTLAANHSGAAYPPALTGMRGSYDAT